MHSLVQAIKVQGQDIYEFGGDPIPIINAPGDTDWKRWGMLNDRKSTRLYFMKENTSNKLYQFLFAEGAYQYDETTPELALDFTMAKNEDGIVTHEDMEDTLNTGSISMLCTPNFEKVVGYLDQKAGSTKNLPRPNNYHVYMQQEDKRQTIHQILWEEGTDTLKLNGITGSEFDITKFPEDTDWDRWAITYDSNRYQLAFRSYVFFAFKKGSSTEIYYGRHGDKNAQDVSVYGYKGTLEVKGAPENADSSSMSMVFDGQHNHLYMLTK